MKAMAEPRRAKKAAVEMTRIVVGYLEGEGDGMVQRHQYDFETQLDHLVYA